MKSFSIGRQKVSEETPPLIIAEVSANHGGSIDRAKHIISLAKDSGADAVKIQSYEPQTLTMDSNREDFLIKEGLWKGRTLYDLYSEAYTPFDWHRELFDYAREINITLFSSPFDETSIDLLEELDTPAYKIASFELCDLKLIARAAQTKKPLLMSTGLSSISEIEDALSTARDFGADEILLFHCISSYPAEAKDSCLKNISFLKEKFNVLVGLSDHTIDNTASIASTVLGVSAIEKHFIDSRECGGVDSTFSIEPNELTRLKKVTYDAWSSVQKDGFIRPQCENENVKFKRSIYFSRDLNVGDLIDKNCIRIVRPGFGLPPKYFDQIIGRKISKQVYFGQKTSWDCFEEENIII